MNWTSRCINTIFSKYLALPIATFPTSLIPFSNFIPAPPPPLTRSVRGYKPSWRVLYSFFSTGYSALGLSQESSAIIKNIKKNKLGQMLKEFRFLLILRQIREYGVKGVKYLATLGGWNLKKKGREVKIFYNYVVIGLDRQRSGIYFRDKKVLYQLSY